MSIRKFLDVSAGHLSITTWQWLDEQTTDDVVRDPFSRSAAILGGRTRHGWFVYASEDPASPIPPDLANLMGHARQRGCEYVLPDTEALPLEDRPVLQPEFEKALPTS